MSNTKLPEMTFKPGDYVWTPAAGFVVLKGVRIALPLSDGRFEYRASGRFSSDDAARTILTIAEARKLGLEPPRRTRKEMRYAWLHQRPSAPAPWYTDSATCPPALGLFNEWCRAPWLDGEVEVEEGGT